MTAAGAGGLWWYQQKKSPEPQPEEATIDRYEYTITLNKNDTPRARVKQMYEKLGLDKAMQEIYPAASYPLYQDPEHRYNLFFVMCRSDLQYLQDKDIYHPGDSFTLYPYEILDNLRREPLHWAEHRALLLLEEEKEAEKGKIKKETSKTQSIKETTETVNPPEPKAAPAPQKQEKEQTVTPAPQKTEKPATPLVTTTTPTPDKVKKEKAAPSLQRGKNKTRLSFIASCKKLAIQEMHKYGVPASITLAQAIVESRH
ncbi:MAG: glucosaminidase domain-containing protein [Candidatus Peribacteria bacterium]|nr:MAG: glucosaminidase domain-containing protein [Candidatus Peribacteria bacterium]